MVTYSRFCSRPATELLTIPLAAQIAMYVALGVAGFGVASVTSKQLLRFYHYKNYGVTNSEYVELTQRELDTLEKEGISPDLAKDVFNYLRDEISLAKNAANADKLDHEDYKDHKVDAVKTKHILQKFRRIGHKNHSSILAIRHYFSAELEASKTKIRSYKRQLQDVESGDLLGSDASSSPQESEIKLGPLVEQSPKEMEKMKRDVEYLKRHALVNQKKRGKTLLDEAHDLMQEELNFHETRVGTIQGFSKRLGPHRHDTHEEDIKETKLEIRPS